MSKENLFKLIRSEDVVIWAGSGMSKYAGFPLGDELKKIIFDSLSKSEKEIINYNLSLPDFAEDFFRLKSNNKNTLIKILKKTFIDKEPICLDTHKKLSTISHFKTIITTNYDNLFESTYKNKGQVLYQSKQIPYLEKEKTHIFKVHGDLSEPDSIIITKSDYNNFFKEEKEKDAYWSVVKERLITKCVLFVGYNLEDPNVNVIFEKILAILNYHRKECFLISPNLPQHKINSLIKLDVNYINSTAEIFIDELIQNIKDNIIDDLENGLTSADTVRAFLSNNNISPYLIGDNKSFKLQSLKSIQGEGTGKLNMSFKNQKEFIDKLNDFITGKYFGEFEVPEEFLLDADLSFAGIKLPFAEGKATIKFQSIPSYKSKVDVRFDDGFEYTDIQIKVYKSNFSVKIEAQFICANLIFNIFVKDYPEIQVDFNYKHNEKCSRTKDEIDFLTLLSKLCSGMHFSVFSNDGKLFSKELPEMYELKNETQYFLTFFNNLKQIENHFKIRFTDIEMNSINNESFNNVSRISKIISVGQIEYEFSGEFKLHLVDIKKDTIETFKQLNKTNTPVIAQHGINEIIELFGHKINLGHKTIMIIEPYVVNINEIENKKETNVLIKSKCNKMKISYTNI